MVNFFLFLVMSVVFGSSAFVLDRAREQLRSAFRVLSYVVLFLVVLWGYLHFKPGVATAIQVIGAAVLGTSALAEPGLSSWTKWFGRHRAGVFGFSIFSMVALFYLYVPVTALLSSPGELGIHLGFLLEVNLGYVLAILLGSFLLYSILPNQRMKTALTLCALGLCVVCYSYAYLLPLGYPPMAGLVFEQQPASERDWILRTTVDVSLTLLLSYCGLVFLPKIRAQTTLIVLSFFNLVPITWGVVRWVTEEPADGGSHQQSSHRHDLLAFSPDHPNILVLFLDRFMGGYVEKILEDEPHLRKSLSGFVWHPKTVSAGQNSIAGVHPIFGGYDYTPSEMNKRRRPLVDLSVESFNLLPINFSKHGYDVNFVEPHGLGFTMEGDCSRLDGSGARCSHIPQSLVKNLAEERKFSLRELSRADYADLLVLLGAMRGLPYFMKELLYTKGPWRSFLDHSAGTTFRVWAKLHSLSRISNTDAQKPTLNLFMNLLPHEPYFLGSDCTPKNEMYRVSDVELGRLGFKNLFSLQHYNAARCALLEVSSYFEYLKNEGVYDQTKIVVVSDHGIVGDVIDPSSRARAGRTQENIFVRTRSLLLVKDRGAKGDLTVSEEFLPNAEVPFIVCREIGQCENPYLGQRPLTRAGRDDPFVVSMVPWQFSAQQKNRFHVEQQLLLRHRDPYQVGNWSELPH